jgi:hypothetical protein
MTSSEAQRILTLYRPGSADAQEPEIAAALAQARRDPELRQWFEQHCQFQEAMRRKFHEIPAPDRIRDRVLARRKIVRPRVWWQGPVWLSAAAAVVLLAGVAALWLMPDAPDRFADYRSRMVRGALREYRMDVRTNDLTRVRQHMAQGGAPADFVIPPGLAQVQLAGGGLLRWRGYPVSMVCFERADKRMLYLFVLPRAAVKDPPPVVPQRVPVNKLTTVSWAAGRNTYVLAGDEEPDFLRKYL